MRKQQIFGWIAAAISAMILIYCGALYRLAGFTAFFAAGLFGAMIAEPILLLFAYRRLGTLPLWLFCGGFYALLWWSMQDPATALLSWGVCCATPLAVSFFWPAMRGIRPMAYYALPAAGGLWLAALLGYCKMHFGSWNLSALTQRLNEGFIAMAEQLEQAYLQLYEGALPEQLIEPMEQFKALSAQAGFSVIMALVYTLFGVYFAALWLADRSLPREQRWLGSWRALVPDRMVSRLYMPAYLIVIFLPSEKAAAFLAVLNLFGFFFVFTALYWLRRRFAARGMNSALQFFLIALMAAAAYLTVGGALLLPYSVLMCMGWWLALAPRLPQQGKGGDER